MSHRESVPGEAIRQRVTWSESVATADVVVLQRRLFNLRDQGRLRQYARTLVFDFDDSITLACMDLP